MSKFTMRMIIEFIVHLYDKYFGILNCDLSYLPYVFYAELSVTVFTVSYLSIKNKSYPVKLLSCSSRTNSIVGIPHHKQKACYIPFHKMIFYSFVKI